MTLLIVACIVVVASFPQSAHAVAMPDVGAVLGLSSADLTDVVVRFLKYALGMLGLIAVIMVMIGGFRWMLSAGDEEKLAQAKRTISGAIVGTIIVLMAWAIVHFVINSVNNVT